MMYFLRKIDFKYGLIFLGLFLISLIFYIDSVKDLVLLSVGWLLTNKILSYILVFGIILTEVVHYLKFNDHKKLKETDFEEFKKTVLNYLLIILSPATLIGSASILKGLAMTYFFETKYFNYFNNAELIFITIIAFYFFVKSTIEFKATFTQLWLINTEKIEPISEEDK